MPSRNTALLDLFRRGLSVSSARHAAATLGDRDAYVGVSELGRYLECPRAAVLDRIGSGVETLERTITLSRGHWFENGVAQALLGAGAKFIPQLEIAVEREGVPVRAHLDFVLPTPGGVVALEVKSMGTLPESPHDAHMRQVDAQIGLLKEHWGDPVFSLRDAEGRILHDRRTFPQICRDALGVKLPATPDRVCLEGWLLCLSMRDGRAFGPYTPKPLVTDFLLRTAGEFWERVKAARSGSMEQLPYATGFHPLCAWCGHAADCPKFCDEASMAGWEAAIAALDERKRRRDELDTAIRATEDDLRRAYEKAGVSGWISTGGHRFRVSDVAGRKSLDRDGLRNELLDIFASLDDADDIDVDALLARHEKVGAGWRRLTINPVRA